MTSSEVVQRHPGELTSPELAAFEQLYHRVAPEFIPPLTVRRGTMQRTLRGVFQTGDNEYFHEMLSQENLLIFAGDQLGGFLSFRPHHHDRRFAEYCPCLYVSTIAVSPAHRQTGLARKLYAALFGLPESLPSRIVLRTWSTNLGHLQLLKELEFETILTIPNDRDDAIDTCYLAADRTARTTARGAPHAAPAHT